MACELGLGSWHVVQARAMSHDGRDYLVHGLGKGLCHFMGTDWAWANTVFTLAGQYGTARHSAARHALIL